MGGGQRSKPTLTPTETILLDIVRLAVAGHGDRIPARLRRLLSGASARRTDAVSPACRDALLDLLKTPPSDPPRRTAGLRVHESARVPQQPPGRTEAPVFAPRVADTLERIVRERREGERLQQLGLEPTRTILLSGPPGVGKTMTAEYLATQLDLPLLRAEPSTVITSLLGESARRLAETFAEASAHPCVLLLDEFDAFAKRRDDAHELGELKRFVTTLLVEIERFPASSLLVAATNHPQLLDPAIDRRFDVVVDLPLPGEAERTRIVSDQLRATGLDATSRAVGVLVAGSVGMSGSAIARAVKPRLADTCSTTSRSNSLSCEQPSALIREGLTTRLARLSPRSPRTSAGSRLEPSATCSVVRIRQSDDCGPVTRRRQPDAP